VINIEHYSHCHPNKVDGSSSPCIIPHLNLISDGRNMPRSKFVAELGRSTDGRYPPVKRTLDCARRHPLLWEPDLYWL
jgi:hypothetical protein